MNNAVKTDEELAVAALSNADAFGVLVRRYENSLLRYILRISRFSEAEAEDIAQESFLHAWRHLADFDASLKFSSWLYRIAHNETISLFRKWKSRGGEQRQDFDAELFANLPGKRDLSSDLQKKMNAEKITKVLAHLSEKHRHMLVLFFLEEKKYDEISDILKMPMGSVATNLHRAKKAFHKKAATLFPELSESL